MVNKHVFNESQMCDVIHYITISEFPGVVGIGVILLQIFILFKIRNLIS